MNIRKAGIEDIGTLIKLRIDYLKADKGYLTEDEETAICTQLKEYFGKHLHQDFIAFIAEVDSQAASTAFLAIVEKPANPAFITGKTGTLLNVFTYPEYRRRGLATMLLHKIIEEAKQQRVASIELSATPDGKPLYEKLGFVESKYTSMKLRII